MKKDVAESKVESLRRCVARIEHARPSTADELLENADAQDLLTLNIERAVQMAVDTASHVLAGMEIPAPHRQGMLDEPCRDKMIKAVGFRNIAVHAYRDIDWNIVYSIATDGPADFREYVRQITTYLDITSHDSPET